MAVLLAALTLGFGLRAAADGAPGLPERPSCDPARLVGLLRTLRRFGAAGPANGTGVSRPALSEADVVARRWLVEELRGDGLDADLDGVGNLFARRPAHAKQPALLLGSHSDSQRQGGWLDGALGVAYAVEAARVLGPAAAVEVVSFSDEEGRFGILTGSPAFARGEVNWQAKCAHGSNVTLGDAARVHGLGKALPLRTLQNGAPLLGYLEAHIEQGPRLERAGQRVAVVEGIVGVHQWRVVLDGEQNHAGSTAMADRRDALAAALRVGSRLNDAARDAAGDKLAVWGVNAVKAEPNTVSVIAGRAELLMQYRAPAPETLEAMAAAVKAVVAAADGEGGVSVRLERYQGDLIPVPFDEALKGQLAAAAAARAPAGATARLWSWAFHDASVVAPVLPTAMLFVPSIGGRSHCFEEDTAEGDIVLGCDVFVQAAADVLRASAGHHRASAEL